MIRINIVTENMNTRPKQFLSEIYSRGPVPDFKIYGAKAFSKRDIKRAEV